MKKIISMLLSFIMIVSLFFPSTCIVFASSVQDDYFNILDFKDDGKGTRELSVSEEKDVYHLVNDTYPIIKKPIDVLEVEKFFEIIDDEIVVSKGILEDKGFSDEELTIIFKKCKRGKLIY